jgi:hypothetical protein
MMSRRLPELQAQAKTFSALKSAIFDFIAVARHRKKYFLDNSWSVIY